MINRNPVKISVEGQSNAARLHELLSDPRRLPEWSSLARKVLTVTGDTLETDGLSGRQVLSYVYDSAEGRLIIRSKRDTFPQEFNFRFKTDGGKLHVEVQAFPGGETSDKERTALEKSLKSDVTKLIDNARG